LDDQKDLFGAGEYTLRKICGRNIEKLSDFFGSEAFRILKPFIHETF
jgi:hypothetical protein